MATDIVSAVSRFLTPEVTGKLAAASGLDSSVARTAVSAAVPSILSGLASIAGTPAGARQLAAAVKDQPVDILGSVVSGLTGSAQMAQQGTSLLSSLLGGGPLGVLTSAVSKFASVGEAPTQTLMGLLTPVIMGVLGREQRAAGLDMNGLARMLTGQKDQIAAAMPSGLNRLLDASGFQRGMASTSSPERRTYDSSRADEPRTAYMQRAVAEPTRTAQGLSWPYWVLPLLALGGLLWYMLPRDRETAERQTTEPVRTSQPAAPSNKVVASPESRSIFLARAPDNWVSIGNRPNDYIGQVIHDRNGQELGSIKDVLIGPDGTPAAVLLNVGRFLGIGDDKDVAVQMSALKLDQQGNTRRIVVDVTKETLQAAPTFDRPKQ
jgi:hypothetical protein